MNEQGVSIVICCHNSEKRIVKTLEHVVVQENTYKIPWEIILVNNSSKDNTVQIVYTFLSNSPHKPEFRIVEQPQLGLIYARMKGIQESKYELISFIDDDNWIDKNWLNLVFEIMTKNQNVGACGGLNKPVTDAAIPSWFTHFQRSYAVGEQDDSSGDITWSRGVLFGAGLTIRKSAWNNLIDQGFSPLLVGRTGDNLTCGEDYEICLALRLNGWKLWYSDKLRLSHYLPANRLNWQYLRNMWFVAGRSSTGLMPYYKTNQEHKRSGCLETFLYDGREWLYEIERESKILRKQKIKTILSRFMKMEGDIDVPNIDKAIGKIISLIKLNQVYDKSIKSINNSAWNKHINI